MGGRAKKKGQGRKNMGFAVHPYLLKGGGAGKPGEIDSYDDNIVKDLSEFISSEENRIFVPYRCS